MSKKKDGRTGKYTKWDRLCMRYAHMTESQWEQAHKDSLAWLQRFENRNLASPS